MNIYSLGSWLAAEAAAVERKPVVDIIHQTLIGGQVLRVDACWCCCLADPLEVGSERFGDT